MRKRVQKKGILVFLFTPSTEFIAQKRLKKKLKKTNVRKYSSVNEEQNSKPYYFTVKSCSVSYLECWTQLWSQ